MSHELFLLKKKILCIYSREMRDRERERERERSRDTEGEAGSMQGAQGGTRSRDSRIMPWAEGRH